MRKLEKVVATAPLALAAVACSESAGPEMLDEETERTWNGAGTEERERTRMDDEAGDRPLRDARGERRDVHHRPGRPTGTPATPEAGRLRQDAEAARAGQDAFFLRTATS